MLSHCQSLALYQPSNLSFFTRLKNKYFQFGEYLHQWLISHFLMAQSETITEFKSKAQVSHATDASIGRHDDLNHKTEQLLENHGNRILRCAYTYLHNHEDAEDILQETLIQFFKYAPVFNDDEHEKAWLLRVAANLSKNRIKYNELRQTDELSENLIASEREDLSFVWDAVRELPVKYREVIHLFYYEGLTTRQISDILKRNESTIRSDLRRGRHLLKKQLKEVYDFDESL